MRNRLSPVLLSVTVATSLLACGAQSTGTKARRGSGAQASTAVLAERTAAMRKIVRAIERMEREGLGHLAVSRADGQLLRRLVLSVRAKRVVEIGTSTGYSGLWLLLGISDTGGTLTTYEYDQGRAAQARKMFADAGASARVKLVEGDAHKLVGQQQGPIDLLFLDADKQGYLDYLQQLLPKVRKGGLIVAHNMVYPKPDPRFIRAITTDPQLSTVFLNMDGAGVAVTQKKR